VRSFLADPSLDDVLEHTPLLGQPMPSKQRRQSRIVAAMIRRSKDRSPDFSRWSTGCCSAFRAN
jgi:hypothetical protein